MERQGESESEKFITSSLINFLNQNIQSSHLNSVDSIVLDYVVSVLNSTVENLATESLKNLTESFDLEEFCEMLTAYFPEFSCIPESVVSSWICDLVSSLKKASEKSQPQREDQALLSLFEEIDRQPRSKRCSESSSESSFNGSKKSSSSRTPRVSETSDSESDVNDIIQRLQFCQLELESKIDTVIEMFPNLPRIDAQIFLSLSNGDLERTVAAVLLAMEGGSYSHSIQSPNGVSSKPRNGKNRSDVDEKVLKDRIVQRYGFIDQAEDAKEFRPAPLKFEPKKLVRYREGQVVSTKGERYTEVRVKDGEEVKPYLAKPNKQ